MSEIDMYYEPKIQDGVDTVIQELISSTHPFAVSLNYSYNSIRLNQPSTPVPIYTTEHGIYTGSSETEGSSIWDTVAAGFNYGTESDAQTEGRSCYIVYRESANGELNFAANVVDNQQYFVDNEPVVKELLASNGIAI
ncbi:hypothetical protein IW147_003893 [Coemansia sp. RSA 720]|nr:hypothetical protein IW147_003893 [Coemansia sp. RSA 720]